MNVNEEYSFTFTVGDKEGAIPPYDFLIDQMQITIYYNDPDPYPLPLIECTAEKPYQKVWTSEVFVPNPIGISEEGFFRIQFEDLSLSDKYWTISGLTIEEGERTIRIEAG